MKIDPQKVQQMLDAKWLVKLYVGGLGTVVAVGVPPPNGMYAAHPHLDDDGEVVTDDFTVEKALTRLAYKVLDSVMGEPWDGEARDPMRQVVDSAMFEGIRILRRHRGQSTPP